ncbi:MAG: beta-phosphoglucomutase family hydrolase [Deltaproteobacteria bacterium]|nr:MAG: beta-phosphoglucomutase family hydrolase [Deltaproteobacteria bacterium]
MNPISPDRFDAVLFDLDGVLTATAKVHAACWKKLFDEFLEERAKAAGEPLKPFDIDSDYKLYVDGKLRYEGVRSFLGSRGIDLPEGTPDESPNSETVCGLGNRKDALVHEVLEADGVEAYEGSVRLVEQVRSRGIRTAVVSASKNCKIVMEAARISHLFDQVVDGEVAERLRLPGKPKPDTFLTAAERLGVVPERAVVVEDAISGVQAGRAGGFGLVIGVDRKGDPESLRQSGADIVVKDLSELV